MVTFTYNGFDYGKVKSVGRRDLQKPEGTCHFCGSGIRYIIYFKHIDGSEIILGSTCGTNLLKGKISDTFRRVLNNQLNGLEKIKKKIKKDKVDKANDKLIEDYWNFTDDEDIILALKKFDHPNKYYRSVGKTFYDYYMYMFGNGCIHSKEAQLKVCRKIKKILK